MKIVQCCRFNGMVSTQERILFLEFDKVENGTSTYRKLEKHVDKTSLDCG